jgi:polyphosphate kinase 2
MYKAKHIEPIVRDTRKIKNKVYEKELRRLQIELVKLQEWIKFKGLKVIVIFEGRDAAGKGGMIKRISQCLNPRICKVVALGTPTEREKQQWYFQRYVAHLPAAGEMILFDRSWYNRAGVERVMGFCNDDQYEEFMRTCPEFERMLIRSGIILIKYWFSVSDEEQEARFQARLKDPTKRWKLSPMDLASREKWVEYSMAKDEMLKYTDTKQAPWYIVPADNKKRARLNCITHLLAMISYKELPREKIKLPVRLDSKNYVRPPYDDQTVIPEIY